MEIFQLIYAVTLAETLNFSKAAEKLFITQPTLSQQIQKLEAELKFKLFVRDSKHVSVTPLGKEFVYRAQKVIDEFNNFARSIKELDKNINTELVFGASPISSPDASKGLLQFITYHPQINLRYVEAWGKDSLSQVSSGEIDVALCYTSQDFIERTNLKTVPIREEYTCAVVDKTHRLASRDHLSLNDLQGERLLFPSPQAGLRTRMLDALKKEAVVPGPIMDIMGIEARLTLLRQGSVTFALNRQARAFDKENFVVIPFEPKIYRTLVLATTAEKYTSMVVKSFFDIIKKSIDEPDE